jgi:hypothetical protein
MLECFAERLTADGDSAALEKVVRDTDVERVEFRRLDDSSFRLTPVGRHEAAHERVFQDRKTAPGR